ncbi:MAG: Rieske 2Fe-2S domain-containing protein [Pseudonocardiales bacterium]|nr:Rieske 2Fe-2S domain-containing protein [Pseudonocardiales bacterium]
MTAAPTTPAPERAASGLLAPPSGRIRPEGEGGFSASWFPVALSSEVGVGQVVGKDFLHGRAVVYRGADGVARVRSAYCRHLGADLSGGTVVGDNIACPFHAWEYGPDGTCAHIPAGDRPVPRARLFPFPTAERYGLIWAFNGLEPAFDIPGFDGVDSDALASRVFDDPYDYPVDPYVIFSNSLDLQHLTIVHELRLVEPVRGFDRDAASIGYRALLTSDDFGDMDQYVKITGTNIFTMDGVLGGARFRALAAGTPTVPGHTKNYSVVFAPRDAGTPEEVENMLIGMEQFTVFLTEGDQPVLQNIHFREDTLLSGPDQALMMYLRHVREFPREELPARFCR